MKKILAFICVIVLCFSIVGCDNLELAVKQKEDGNYADAEKTILKYIDKNKDSEIGYLELADIYIRQNKIQQAYDILMEGSSIEDSYGIEDKLLEFNVANVLTDSDELVRGRCYIDETDTLVWYHVYNYDENGTRTGITLYDGKSNEVARLDFEYNTDKKPLQYYSYCNDGSLGKLLFEYNAVGNVTKITEYENGGDGLLGYTYIEYNKNGYKSKETNVFADYSPHWEYTYNYDDEKSGTVDIAFFGKTIGNGEFVVNEYGKIDITTRRTQGYFDIDISHDFDYESNEERVEVGDEMGGNVRTVCYGSSYFPEGE